MFSKARVLTRINTRGYAKKVETKAEPPKPVAELKDEFNGLADVGKSAKYYWPAGALQNLTEGQKEALKDFNNHRIQAMKEISATYGKELKHPFEKLDRAWSEATADLQEPIRVAVTGAAGQIGYAMLFRIASGDVFGPRTPVSLHLLELPGAMKALEGVLMELRDCAFPVLRNVVVTSDAEKAFEGIDYALLVGASPRTKGMERSDLLLKNAEIFSTQGRALNKVGKGKDTRIFVVGNPANTNALIAASNAPNIPAENFAAMTKLDHNRGLSQLAAKANCSVSDIDKFIIWGNHSSTQFPDIAHATIKGNSAPQVVNDNEWVEKVFIPTVQNRGAAVINARKLSSAASPASACMENIREWHYGTQGKWTSVAVPSKGEYGVTKGLYFSYPVVYNNKGFEVIEGLSMSESAAVRMEATHKELLQERDGVAKFLKN